MKLSILVNHKQVYGTLVGGRGESRTHLRTITTHRQVTSADCKKFAYT